MKLLRIIVLGSMFAGCLVGPTLGRADDTNTPPDFKEVYDLLRANLAGQTEADLNQAAVKGMLEQLRTKASLVTSKNESNAAPEAAALTQSRLFDGGLGYLRIGRVADGLADQILSAWKKLGSTNTPKGLVLDLRFANGHDYAAAAAAAEVFVAKELPLLDWGNGVVKSKEKTNAVTVPVVILVNRQTSAAAEALAGVLRESDQAVILGANTAGEATIGRDFPLKNGQFLRIATAAIKLGSGEPLTGAGLKPDIAVSVKPDDERAYYADPYKEFAATGNLIAVFSGTTGTTNRGARTRTSEADLIRERKERPGVEVEGSLTSAADPEQPVVRDPALARALDLIRGIVAFRQPRTP